MKYRFTFFIMMIGLFGFFTTMAQNRSLSSGPDLQKDKLLKLAETFNQRHLVRRAELERLAKEKGWTLREETKDGVMEIQFVDEFGYPQAYRTTNLNAGRTTNTDDIWVGGSTGLNLTGSGYLVGEWDGGGVLTTHQEFNNGAGTRVTQMDAPGSTHYHSTHVAGTIIGEGQVAAAHGMATQALLNAYEWTNDVTEMTTAAANGLTLSNHSYGWNRGWVSSGGNMYWYGNPSISATEDYLFGFYDASSQDWDDIAYNAPNYLIVKSSGNDRNDSYTGSHYVYNGASWVVSNAVRDPDGGADGYDCIEQQGVAKNILTIGAVNDIPAGWVSPASVVQSSFSSWGPTDDGRIKPDLVANGVGVYSCTNTGNADYTTLDGTSMATPNTTGTLVLLQDYYKSLKGGTMSAAALKGLVINTANEAGANNGPDYQNGWGLLNASGAANLITNDNTQGGLIVQSILMNGQTTDYTYYSDGLSPINVTLSWTDPAGTPVAASLNPTNLMLVNDLDVRVIGSSTNFPWMLNPASPAAAATKGDNFRDNVETVNMLTPTAGYYTVRVSHSGALSGGQQAYALIINGMRTPPIDTYCTARSTTWSAWEYISKVVMGSVNHTSGRSPGGFGDYTGMVNTMVKGTNETLTVTIQGYAGDVCKAWIDWNQDGDFADAGEEYTLGTNAGPVFSLSIGTPMTALTGYTTMRVRLSLNSALACGTSSYGETEDYTIKVSNGCDASGGCAEYISRVQAGSIDNSTACNNYTDYTATKSTNLPVNGIVHVTVTNGVLGYSDDQCGIWVDWNRNGVFTDAGETITVTGTPGVGPYTAAIIPPAGQTLGNCTMRVRITWIGTLDPCGSTSFGEVEDYNLNITAMAPNVWTGNFNNYWGNGPNWSLEHIPTADEDVIIPNVNMPCIIDYSPKVCNNLTQNSGATLLVSGNTLTVNGNLDLYGTLAMDNASGILNVMGDIYWESTSSANITAAGIMWIYGFWEFRIGANVQLANGFVDFAGADTKYIRVYSPNCSFNNVGIYKTGTSWLGLSGSSTEDFTINGYLYLNTDAQLISYASQSLFLNGPFYNSGNFNLDYGTLVMNGVNQSIKPNVGDYVNNLTISSSGTTSIDNTFSNTLSVKGNLLIESGVFSPGGNIVQVTGNWTNLVGTAGFAEGTSKVVFNGASHNYVLSSETFNVLEAAMGAALRVNNVSNTVTCNQYLWTSGGIDVLSGTFTALDLGQSGLFGGFWLNPGGAINLFQDNAQFTDLHGDLHIYGGTMTVTGGSGQSWWPYLDNGSIEMSNGVLDFKNNGIYLYNTAVTLTENITGGTIRTNGSFTGTRTDFNPAGGTVELYGTADVSLSHGAGSSFANLLINKSVVVANSMSGNEEVFYSREGTKTDNPMANSVIASSNLVLTGDMTIQTGSLTAPASIEVGGNWTNNVGTAGFVEGTGTVTFNGASDADILTNETFYNMTEAKTNGNFTALELMNNLTVNVTNDLIINDGSFEMNDYTTLDVDRNIAIANGAGLNANDYLTVVNVAGNWSNNNTNHTTTNGFDPGYYSTVTFNGAVDQFLTTACPQEDFFNLTINKSAGKFRSSDNTQTFGDVLISSGTWDDFVSGLTHTVYSDFTVMAGGSFLTTTAANTLDFKGFEHSNLTYSSVSGYFRNLTVNKEIGYSVNQLSNVSVQNNGLFTVNQGYYFLNGNTLLVNGNITVNNAAYLTMSPSASLVLTDTKSLNVNSGGRIDVTGTLANPATIRANVGTAHYTFNINAGGTIAADYGIFKNMGTNGVNVASGATVDLAHAFKGCTFQDGAAAGTLLTLNNAQTMTIRNAVFPTNTWTGTNNVTKTLNTGHVYFVDYSGGFSGEAFDADGFNLIDWVATLTATATAASNPICAGSTSQLNVTRTGGLAPFTYLWSPATGLSNPAIINPVASPTTTTTYTVTVTDALGTTATSSKILTVNPNLPVSITIAASANPSPPGSFVTFTATPVNGGASPAFQWKVNGSNVGTGLSTYSYVPAYNDHVQCILTSNIACPSGNPAPSNVITMIIVAANTSVTGTVPSPLSLCFDASNTITVAGGGTTFIVQSGGSATMVAGMKIRYLPGTTVQSGGYMHGYITSTNTYCGSLPPAMAAVTTGEPEQTSIDPNTLFSIYPNPTSGKFTLLQKGENTNGVVRVEIIGLRGERLLSETIIGERKHEFNVADLAVGLYFVRIIKDDHAETFKLVLTR